MLYEEILCIYMEEEKSEDVLTEILQSEEYRKENLRKWNRIPETYEAI